MNGAGPLQARSLVLVGVALAVLASTACTTTTTVTTTLPHTSLILDDHDQGAVGDGKAVEVGPGYAPVPWQLKDGDVVVAEGAIARTEAQWGVVSGAVAAAVCCVPTAAATGFCLANPAVIAGSFACLLVGPGAVLAALQAPTWFTIPVTCASTAAGASPLLLGLVGQAPPNEVVLEKAPAPPTTSQREQSW